MVQLIFYLRYQSQLSRTKPKILRELEKSVLEAVLSYGGTIKTEHKLIYALFTKGTIGFWLDILCLLKTIKSILEKAASELYGHVCIVGENIDERDIQTIARTFPSDLYKTGIWCDPGIQETLKSFIDFDEKRSAEDLTAGYSQVQAIRDLEDTAEIQIREKNNSEKIRSYLKQGSGQNSIIVGDERIGKLEGLYRYCEEQMKGFPPLLVRFREGVNAIICFVDAFSPEIKKHLEEDQLKNMEHLSETLFQERLRDELSEFTVRQGKLFFIVFLDAYKQAAEKQSVKPIMILENVQSADPMAKHFIKEIINAYPARERIKLYGTATKLKALESWEELFPRIIKFTPEKTKSQYKPVLLPSLWEMGYCCELLKRYFPSFLLPQLLQEEGKNPVMIEITLAILSHLRSTERIDFIKHAEEIPETETEAARALVRRRLLAYVKDGRLKPCFPLLIALSDLGFQGDDQLILESLNADLANGTFKGIQKSIEEDTFSSIAGEDKALVSIVNTQKALNYGNKEEVILAFKETAPLGASCPGVKINVLTNTASYFLGICDTRAAEDSVKEAMLLAQKENSGRGLARIYRLFSLVEFANQELSDAIDYFSFAIENAEKADDYTELGISYYYAAVAHFIFGNISMAKNLAVKARKTALEAILPGWADRSRFLEGRLCFETGFYQEALDIFKELRKEPYGSETEGFKQTVDAWVYRANIYLNNSEQKPRNLKGIDARLFETEAAFIKGDYQKTLDLIKKLENTEIEEHFVMIEQPDWRSGFYQCELLIFSRQDLWNRMLHSFRVLSLCCLNGGKENPTVLNDRDEAIREMQRIIRNNLPETDPNDTLYLYSYYRILKLTEAPEVDLNTAISLAFKRLQKRASRIDNNETKRAFLFTHYWNSSLTAAAKEHKLI